MKTHELAAFLRELSAVLSLLPDTELTALPDMLKSSSIYQGTLVPAEETKRIQRNHAPSDNIYATLATLSKGEIVQLLSKANVSIDIRSKDSAKDAARKISTHLTRYPTLARSGQTCSVLRQQRPALVSEPLSKALETLLGNRDEVPLTSD